MAASRKPVRPGCHGAGRSLPPEHAGSARRRAAIFGHEAIAAAIHHRRSGPRPIADEVPCRTAAAEAQSAYPDTSARFTVSSEPVPRQIAQDDQFTVRSPTAQFPLPMQSDTMLTRCSLGAANPAQEGRQVDRPHSSRHPATTRPVARRGRQATSRARRARPPRPLNRQAENDDAAADRDAGDEHARRSKQTRRGPEPAPPAPRTRNLLDANGAG